MVGTMRLRLRCSTAYSLGDFQRSMVHVPDHVQTIGDFAKHVSRLLDLGAHGGDDVAPQFLLDGFLVPHSEELRIVLRDDEVVDVERSDRIVGFAAPCHGKRALENTSSTVAVTAAEVARNDGLSPGQNPPKRSRRPGGTADSGAAMMAIGWQPPAAKTVAAVSAVTSEASGTAKTTSASTQAKKPRIAKKQVESSSSSSSEDESDEEAAVSKAATASPAKTDDAARPAAVATRGAAAEAPVQEAAESLDANARSIYVGGLPLDVDDKGLRKHFERYGSVEHSNVILNNKGISKCFGFVEFVDAKTRACVLAEGGTQKIHGKMCEVKERTGGKGGSGKGKGGKGGKGKKGKTGKDTGGKASRAAGPLHVVMDDKSSSEEESENVEDVKTRKAKELAAAKERAIAEANAFSATISDSAKKPISKLAQTSAADTTAMPGPPGKPAKKIAAVDVAPEAEGDPNELTDIQKQMAALGLPVSFTGNYEHDEDDDSDEDADEDEDDES